MIIVAFLAIAQQVLSVDNVGDALIWNSTYGVDLNSVNTTMAWENYKTYFGKSYPNTTENEKRKSIWLENWNDINEHNKLSNKTHSEGLNQYSDLSQAEFLNTAVGINESAIPLVGDIYIPVGGVAVDSIDWRMYNGNSYVTPVKNQGQCGSCWAFATNGVIESRVAIETNVESLISLSEQQLVSCYAGNCNGNWPTKAMDWIENNNGLCSSSEYPYTSGDKVVPVCNANCGVKFGGITGYTQVQANSEQKLQEAVADGPVVVFVKAGSSSFRNLKGGILTAECDTGNINHAVVAVGYGTEDDIDYWIIRNSWGENWGVNGYGKICRNCTKNVGGQCGIVEWKSAIPTISHIRNDGTYYLQNIDNQQYVGAGSGDNNNGVYSYVGQHPTEGTGPYTEWLIQVYQQNIVSIANLKYSNLYDPQKYNVICSDDNVVKLHWSKNCNDKQMLWNVEYDGTYYSFKSLHNNKYICPCGHGVCLSENIENVCKFRLEFIGLTDYAKLPLPQAIVGSEYWSNTTTPTTTSASTSSTNKWEIYAMIFIILFTITTTSLLYALYKLYKKRNDKNVEPVNVHVNDNAKQIHDTL